MIYDDSYLFNHFCFIVYLSDQLIGYNMTASQKTILLKILQTKYPTRNRVLSIGDSYSDALLFQLSDYAIQVTSKYIYSASLVSSTRDDEVKLSKHQPLQLSLNQQYFSQT